MTSNMLTLKNAFALSHAICYLMMKNTYSMHVIWAIQKRNIYIYIYISHHLIINIYIHTLYLGIRFLHFVLYEGLAFENAELWVTLIWMLIISSPILSHGIYLNFSWYSDLSDTKWNFFEFNIIEFEGKPFNWEIYSHTSITLHSIQQFFALKNLHNCSSG